MTADLEKAHVATLAFLAKAEAHKAQGEYPLALADLKSALAIDRTNQDVVTAMRDLLVLSAKKSAEQTATTTSALLTALNSKEEKEAVDAAQRLASLSADSGAAARLLQDGALEAVMTKLLQVARTSGKSEALQSGLLRVLRQLSRDPPAAVRALVLLTEGSVDALLGDDPNDLTALPVVDLLASTVLLASTADAANVTDFPIVQARGIAAALTRRLRTSENDKLRVATFGALIKTIANEAIGMGLIQAHGSALFDLVLDPNENIKGLVPAALVRIFEQVVTEGNRKAVREACATEITRCIDSSSPKTKTKGLLALSAVMQANDEYGSAIFAVPGLLESVVDCVESDAPSTQLALLEVLSNACTQKTNRDLVSAHCMSFLNDMAKSRDVRLSSAASVTLTKLVASNTDLSQTVDVNAMASVDAFIAVLADTKVDTQSHLRAMEGLAYLSIQPRVKDHLTSHPTFLPTSVRYMQSDRGLAFGFLTVLASITGFRRKLSQEEEQVKNLRKMAKDTSVTDDPDAELDTDARVMVRGIKVVQHGCVPAMFALVKKGENASPRIQDLVAQILCSLATNRKLHSVLVQQGAARGLVELARSTDQSTASEEGARLAAHAIAKIAITVNPNHAFQSNLAADLVRPLLSLLTTQHTSSSSSSTTPLAKPSQPVTNQLAQFEALMALTNLGSMNDDIRARIVHAGGIRAFEELLFADHDMVRRAAAEAICNMMFDPTVFAAYAGDATAVAQVGASAGAFKILLALADAEDFATRRAAAGAIAILSSSPTACRRIVAETFGANAPGDRDGKTTSTAVVTRRDAVSPGPTITRGVQIVVGLLAPPSAASGLSREEASEIHHRGVECVKNLAAVEKGMAEIMVAAGALDGLKRLARDENTAVARGAVEALAAVAAWRIDVL
ncbi:hypothetical protein HKX48_001151 [Thoreauomyces humboldtii]|nr:hypothetical protein HKX48_001151 [Thoreauomyces humboldtii]